MDHSDRDNNDSMVDADSLLRVFWPSDAPRSELQGTIVGWRNSELDIFVVSILEEVEVEHPHSPPSCTILTI